MKLKKAAAVCTAILTMSFFSFDIYASAEKVTKDLDSSSVSDSEESLAIRGEYDLPIGGMNEYNNEAFKTKADAIQKEQEIKKRGYVLVSSDVKQITDEQFEMIKEAGFWFGDYLDEEDMFRWEFGRVYIYKPLLEKFCSNYSKGISDTLLIRLEIEQSAVLFAYEYWYAKDRVGKISDEFNDNIPKWYKTAYMEINTPENAEVTLINYDKQTYYRFYITKETPFMVKLPRGQYNLVSVNTIKIPRFEDTLPFNGLIQLSEENNDRDHAYVLSLSKTIYKYAIPEGDIGGKPDLSLDQNQNIPEERTVVDADALAKAQQLADEERERQENNDIESEEKTVTDKKNDKKSMYLLAGVITAILFLIWSIADKRRQTRRKAKKAHDKSN